MLIEREVSDEPFEPTLFFFHLSEAPQLAHAEVRVLLLPGVEGGVTHPELSAEVADRGAAFRLADGIDDLLFREFRPLHRSTPFVKDRRSRHVTLVSTCRRFQGRRQSGQLTRLEKCSEIDLYSLQLELSSVSNSNNSTDDPATLDSAPVPVIRSCIKCRYSRLRPKADLFSSAELQTSGGLKAYGEWQQQEKQHAEREAQLVSSGGAFTYEPHHYAWCAAFTPLDLATKASAGDQPSLAELMRVGGATIHPVTGKISPIYSLCLRSNPRGDCDKYEPR
jgi:hypothetical protein